MIRVRSATEPQEIARSHRNPIPVGAQGRHPDGLSVRRFPRFLMALAVGTVVGVTALGTGNVHAQDAGMTRQLEQIRKDLDLLQRYVYREGTPGTPSSATSPDGAGSSTPAAARQQVQINDLQRNTAQLTGQLEEFDFRIRKMEERLERLVADIDFRLSQLEGGGMSGMGPGAGTPLADGQTAPAGTASASAAPAPAVNGAGEPLNDRGTKLFGVIESEGKPPQIPSGPANSTVASGTATPAQTAAVATKTPEEQYREAFALLRKQEFTEAEAALSRFVKEHPNDPLAGNAQYWLGETYYVRGQFENAAIAFTEGFQTYPDSSKAPDNLLKLGMSLANLGKKEDACTTFAHLIDNFPNASNVVLDRARQERKNRGCPE